MVVPRGEEFNAAGQQLSICERHLATLPEAGFIYTVEEMS